jgi:hypothetical protein
MAAMALCFLSYINTGTQSAVEMQRQSDTESFMNSAFEDTRKVFLIYSNPNID